MPKKIKGVGHQEAVLFDPLEFYLVFFRIIFTQILNINWP